MTAKLFKKIRKPFIQMGLIVLIAIGFMAAMTGCAGGKSDEEIIGELGQKFMVALYKSDKALAKEICNKTGYETFEQLSSMVALGSMGMNKDLDDAVLISKLDLIDVKMVNDKKGVARIMDTLSDTPKTYSIPAEKDADGNWKVCVTKQSFN